MNRREFLKITGLTAAATGITLTTNPKKALAVDLGKEHNKFPYRITEDYEGFKEKNIMFERAAWDHETYTDDYIIDTFGYKNPGESMADFGARHVGAKDHLREGEPGYRDIDQALELAAWSVCSHFGNGTGAALGQPIAKPEINPGTGEKGEPVFVPGLYSWDNSMVDRKLANGGSRYEFENPADAARHVKKAVRFLGADLVGIVPYDRAKKWVYSEWSLHRKSGVGSHEDKSIEPDFKSAAGFEPKSVIVMAYEMDYDGFKTAPSLLASASAGVGYSKMAENGHKIATFLRNIGYKAAPCGNDTAMSIPLAIEAGLGEGSRMGVLITEKYGPRVRLAKVFTNLEMTGDKPITFGVKEFCNVCMKCADACPSNAITHEPSQVTEEGKEFDSGKVNKSTMTGVEKWFMNAERCNAFWGHNGGDCGTCISVCPYNKIDEWHHDLSKLMTLTPFKPLLRSMDDWFGYGGPVEPEVRIESQYLNDKINSFWKGN